MNNSIELESIYLVPIDSTYTDLIVRWRNSDLVRNNFIFRTDFTAEMHNNWLETRVKTGEVVQFIIHDINSRRPIGSVYLRDIDHKNNSAEFGIFIGEGDFIGKGVGTQATKAIIDFGFQELHLHRISLRLLNQNQIAKHVYIKAGFKQEGLFKDMVFVDGKYMDIIFMAVIKEDNQ